MDKQHPPGFGLRRVPAQNDADAPVIYQVRPAQHRPLTRREFMQVSALTVGSAASLLGCGGGGGGGDGGSNEPALVCEAPTAPALSEREYFDFTAANIRAHAAKVIEVRFSPDGRFLASAGGGTGTGGARDHTEAKLWSMPSGILRTNLSDDYPVNGLLFNEDGTELVIVKLGNLAFWQMDPPELVHQVEGIGGHTWAIKNGHVRSVTFARGQNPRYIVKIMKIDTAQLVVEYEVPLTMEPRRVKLAPDALTVAISYLDGTVEIHDTSQRTLMHALAGHDDPATVLLFSPDSSLLATASGLTYGSNDDNPDFGDTTIKLWDTQTGTLVRTLTGHTNSINDLSFSTDGTVLVSGSGGNTSTGGLPTFHDPGENPFASPHDENSVRVWDVATGSELLAVTGNPYRILSVAISPDGQYVATGSLDNTIKVWRMPAGDFVTGLFDANALEPEKQVHYVAAQRPDGALVQRALPTTAELPTPAACTCNCVAGSYERRPGDGGGGGGGPCVPVCVCIPVFFP